MWKKSVNKAQERDITESNGTSQINYYQTEINNTRLIAVIKKYRLLLLAEALGW